MLQASPRQQADGAADRTTGFGPSAGNLSPLLFARLTDGEDHGAVLDDSAGIGRIPGLHHGHTPKESAVARGSWRFGPSGLTFTDPLVPERGGSAGIPLDNVSWCRVRTVYRR